MEKKVEFKVGSETLRGKLYVPEGKGPFPGVIFFHGSGGSGGMYFDLAEKFASKGIIGFAFNYRGAGLSDGVFEEQTLSMGIEDAKAALEFFISLPELDKKRIGLLGASFGGFLAGLLAKDFPISSLILFCSAAYDKNGLSKQRDFAGELNERTFLNSESYANIERYEGKLLVIENEKDEVLLPGMEKEYYDRSDLASKKDYFILEDAKHKVSDDPPVRSALTEKVISWFLETL